ncbi:MAG: glycoside hydrolase family 57 [Actinomycetota bacterium]|nr:glycoside hydrolase family 57 [Actinomycetota bacterium]
MERGSDVARVPGPSRELPTTVLVCMFHLNLAFSSLEEADQPRIVERCYWPMLGLADRYGFSIGIEVPAWTLERIEAHDPSWIAAARRLIAEGRLELVGSGYAQCAAPLLPAEVNRWNLRLGLDAYRMQLGVKPRLALVGEQAYAPGLVGLYREAGYEGIIADWDNAYRSHPEWDSRLRRYPQLARGPSATIPVVWSESIAFQRFQRFAHGEMTHADYRDFVTKLVGGGGGALLLYANDAEIFDHRPGRFAAEPPLGEGEWDRVAEGLEELQTAGLGSPVLPSTVLELLEHPQSGHELSLESTAHPIPVKKQAKYNIGRWAVTGRDDVGINTRCWRIYERLRERQVTDPNDWRELCTLWASDFRTHITESRWASLQEALTHMEQRLAVREPPSPRPAPVARGLPSGVAQDGVLVRISSGPLQVTLNTRRGLAIHEFRDLRISEASLFGTLEHGYFGTIDLGADWYSGNLVQEAPLDHKVSDLERTSPAFEQTDDGSIRAWAEVPTKLGVVEKAVTVRGEAAVVELEYVIRWPELPVGSLRAGIVTLNPEAFDAATLSYATHNGSDELEHRPVTGPGFDHGEPVSALVSTRDGIGVTGGVVLLGDARTQLRIEVDAAVAKPMGLIAFRPAGDQYFMRLSFSITESDDTRRGAIARDPDAPQRLRLIIGATSSD